jgi:hypothetical protein
MWEVLQAFGGSEPPLPMIHELVTHTDRPSAERIRDVTEAPSPPPLTRRLGWLVTYHVRPEVFGGG